MLGGIVGTAVRAFGLGLTLGGMLIAAAPRISVGVAIAYLGIAVFITALIWPIVEYGFSFLSRIAATYVHDTLEARRIERQHGKEAKDRYLSIDKEGQHEAI